MLKILHFTCKQEFEKCSTEEIMEARLVTYEASPHNIYVVKSICTRSNRTITHSEYRILVKQTVNEYLTPYNRVVKQSDTLEVQTKENFLREKEIEIYMTVFKSFMAMDPDRWPAMPHIVDICNKAFD